VRSPRKVQEKATLHGKVKEEVKVEAEAEAVAEAGSTNTGSHIHGKVQKEREKVQKAKAKEKATIQVMVQDIVQKAVQRAQASMVQKVAVSLQSLAIRVVRKVTLQINVTVTKVINLWFNKFSKIRRIINRCILHLSFQVLVLQQCINFRQDYQFLRVQQAWLQLLESHKVQIKVIEFRQFSKFKETTSVGFSHMFTNILFLIIMWLGTSISSC
jgi:hypothetical protein